MKKYIYFLTLIVHFLAFCQKETVKITNSITKNADSFIGTDGFGNYFFMKGSVFHKKSENLDLQYTNFALGTPSKIDIINPLKIVLFYEIFNTAILLDSQLNEIQKIDFSKTETAIIANSVGLSSSNNLWVFNNINQQLLLYNMPSSNLKNIGNIFRETPIFYQSNFNYFYWINNQNELFSISIFGSIIPFGKIKLGDNYQIINDEKIIIYSNNEFFLYDFHTKLEHKLNIVEKSFKNFYYKDQILSIFTNEEIINYKIIIP